MIRRIIATLGVLTACALVGAPGAFAGESPTAPPEASLMPPGANGYHSAYYNYRQMMAEKQATHSAATVKNGVTTAGPSWSCGAQGWFASRYTGLYVSDELGYAGGEKGMLRARSSSVGPWELYQFCGNAQTGAAAIFADGNAAWVSTEVSYSGALYGMLRARSFSIGAWEEYSLAGVEGAFSIWSAANARWVSAEYGDSGNWWGMLRARSETIGAWESYAGTAF
jgi:hypothetical protein